MRAKDLGFRKDKFGDIHAQHGSKSDKEDTNLKSDSTDVALFVRTSDEEIQKWDKKRIFDTLIRETDIHEDAAIIIATEVEKLISENAFSLEHFPSFSR